MVDLTSAGRVQGPGLNLTPQLQSGPVVGGVMVAPQNLSGAGSNLSKIADSLASMGADVSQLGTAIHDHKVKAQQQQAATDQLLTPPEIAANMRTSPEKYGNVFYSAMAGRATANALGPMIDNWTTTEWDSTKEDYSTFVSRKLQEEQMKLPTGEAQAAFGETASGWVNQAVAKHQSLINDTAVQNRDNIIFSDYSGLIESGKRDKLSPDLIWRNIVTTSNENRLFLNLPGVNQNAILLSLADKAAEAGDADMAKAILNGVRGVDGKTPALSTIPDLLPTVQAISQKAEQKYRENNVTGRIAAVSEIDTLIKDGGSDVQFQQWAAKNKGVLTADGLVSAYSQLVVGRDKRLATDQWKADGVTQRSGIDAQISAALLRGEGFNDFGKTTVNSTETVGSKVEFNVDQRVNEVVNSTLDGVYTKLPQDVADVEAAKYLGANGRTYKGWESLFASVSPASIEAQIAEGKISPQLIRAVELYGRLSGTYGGVLSTHIKGEGTKAYLDAVTFMIQDMGLDPQDAMAKAAKNTFGPNAGSRKAIAQGEVASAFSQTSITLNYDLAATASIKATAENLAVSANVHGAEALTKAQAIFDSSNIQVLGTYIPKNDTRIPPNIDKIMESYAQDWVTTHGAKLDPPITSADEITVQYSDGRLMMMNKEDGTAIRVPSGRDQNGPGSGFEIVTMNEARQYWNIKQDTANAGTLADSVAKANKGWFFGLFGGNNTDNPAPNPNGGNASLMFGISKPEQVSTLNSDQLREVQKSINAGTLDKQFTDKSFTDLVTSEIKKRDEEARMKVLALTGVDIAP